MKGESAATWETPDTLRDRLLAGSRWLLVDEYQDINAPQYEFLSALAGRTLQDKEGKLNLLAVGDDDQNIYEFTGAQVEFIRRFEQDYDTKVNYLVENFRSTANIIAAANALIDRHPDRLKVQHPIAINAGRRKEPAGGVWKRRDAAVSEGRVQVLSGGANYQTQGWLALQELRRLADLDEGWHWSGVAVIAREWRALDPVRAGCGLLNVPCYFAGRRERIPPNRRLREVARFLNLLNERRGERMPLQQLQTLVSDLCGDEPDSPGTRLVMEFIEDFGSAVGEGVHPIAVVMDAAYEFLAEADRQPGDGMCLTTAHGAKGLEFNHVVVLDGGWHTSGPEALAERRLYYVAMTRARHTLTLCRLPGKSFADELVTLPNVFARSELAIDHLPDGLSKRFELIGLGDVDMDFAGRSQDAAVRRAIADLKNGDELVIEPLPGQSSLAIKNVRGQMIGRTAKSYVPPVGRIVSGRVAAICVRRLQDVTTEWQSRMVDDKWEVVLPELVIENNSS